MSPDPFFAAARSGRPVEGRQVIDSHTHLGHGPDFPLIRPTPEALVASMDRLGIAFSCVSAIPAIYGDAEHGNSLVEQALREHPGRFFGYFVSDVGYPEKAARQLESAVARGFRGLKVWSYGARPGLPYDHPNYDQLFDFANRHRMPVLAHVFGPEMDELAGRFERFPDIRWLLAHVGSAEWDKYIRAARRYPSVFVELCLSSCPRGLVEQLVAEGLEDKTVWGSDAPFLDQASQFGRVAFAQIPLAAKRKILRDNALRVLGVERA